jgi:hypothetical protein
MVKFLPGCVVDKGEFQQSTKDKGLADLETKNEIFLQILCFDQ